MRKELRVLETFSGIGAPRKALMRGGYNFKIVDSIEIDPNPIKSYNAIYSDNIIPQDISQWNKTKQDIGEIDLLWNSSPCQDFSLAGSNKSGNEGSGTRSSLVYEVIRIAKEFTPKYIVWENVKGLTTKKHKHVLEDYIQKLDELGYNSSWKILKASDYGLPQNRERLFVVSILNDEKYIFPNTKQLIKSWKDFENKNYDELLKAKPNKTPSREKMKEKCKNITNEKCCSTITTKQDRWPNAGIIDFEDYYRFLTPREQWLLMGFDNSDFERAKEVNNKKSMLEKQARK